MLAVRERAVGRVDGRDDVLDHHLFERARRPWACSRDWPLRRLTRLRSKPAIHDDEHRYDASVREQVVQDEIDLPLAGPAGLVLATAVLQIEHRVAYLRRGVIAGRCVDEETSPLPGDGGVI